MSPCRAEDHNSAELESTADHAGICRHAANNLKLLSLCCNCDSTFSTSQYSALPSSPAITMKPFAHLPDLCLLALFKQLPLNDQLQAQRVSFRWSQLVVEVTRARRQLNILGNWDIDSYEGCVNNIFTYADAIQKMEKLLVKADGTLLYPFSRLTAWNSLKYEHLSEEIVRQISSTFTGVKELQVAIAFVSAEQLDHLALLLTHWRDQLVALKLHDCIEEAVSRPAITRLLTAVNSLSALKHLKLNLRDLPVYDDLPIVAQLEKLHFASARTPPEVFVSILKRHAQANAALQIEYQNVQCKNMHSFITLSEQLRHAFTQLIVGTSLITQLRWLERICTNFPSLQYLDCDLYSTTVRHLFGHLSKLHQLVYLQLEVNFSTMNRHDDQAHLPLPQLPSVKGLELCIALSTHKDLEQLQLHWTMPNLQAIELGFCISSKCTDCDINYNIYHQEIFKPCFRHLFRHLKLTCSQLRSIRYNLEYICGTVEELLAEV